MSSQLKCLSVCITCAVSGVLCLFNVTVHNDMSVHVNAEGDLEGTHFTQGHLSPKGFCDLVKYLSDKPLEDSGNSWS